jgi:hypothetical protein
MRLKVTILCALAVALALAGCGGGGEDSGGDATNVAATQAAESANDAAPLSKAAFLKQADQICRRAGAKIRREIQQNKVEYGLQDGSPTNKEREKAIVDLVLPEISQQTSEIAELGVPKGDEDEVAAIVAALEKGVTETEEDPSLALGGPNPFNEASKLSRQYGLKQCR